MLEGKAFKCMAEEFGAYLYLRLIRGTMCVRLVDRPGSNIKVGCSSDRRHSGRTVATAQCGRWPGPELWWPKPGRRKQLLVTETVIEKDTYLET